MDKVLGKGVACRSEEEKSDLEQMPSCAPKVCGMEGLTVVDANEGLTLGGWEIPRVNGDVVVLDPSRVPNMVETMALTDDTVGFIFVETSESRVRDGVTIPKVCAGLELSAVKDTEEATVEVGPSIDRGGVAILKVGLFKSKYGKGVGDGLALFGEGEDGGV